MAAASGRLDGGAHGLPRTGGPRTGYWSVACQHWHGTPTEADRAAHEADAARTRTHRGVIWAHEGPGSIAPAAR